MCIKFPLASFLIGHNLAISPCNFVSLVLKLLKKLSLLTLQYRLDHRTDFTHYHDNSHGKNI